MTGESNARGYSVVDHQDEWLRMFESLPFPITFQDSECFIVEANRAARDLLGLKNTFSRMKCYTTFLDIEDPPDYCKGEGGRRKSMLVSERSESMGGTYTSICVPNVSVRGVIGSMHMAIPVGGIALAPETSEVYSEAGMSGRECEVMGWLKEGKSNWEIARLMGIAEDTVKYHLKRMMHKLNVVNRVQLVSRVMEREKLQVQRRMETMIKEAHHRTLNNLSALSGMISMMEQRVSGKALRETLSGLQCRIRSISRLHTLLQDMSAGEKISMQKYIRQIAENVTGCFSEYADEIRIEVHAEDLRFDSKRAVACGLIVNELLTNCIKHAFKGRKARKIAVDLRSNGPGKVRLMVSDNGKGFPMGFDHKDTDSLGLKLVEALALQLGGKMEVRGTDGAEVIVRFPLER